MTDVAIVAVPVALALAWYNGANDNIKGAATLVGSGLSSARAAIAMATAATAVGGLVSIWLLHGLLAAFSGRGLVPDDIAGTAAFLVPVGLGAAATVGTATRLGLPVSTTHALVGALLGAGLVAAPDAVAAGGAALAGLALPLVLVPLAALLLALAAIPAVRGVRARAARTGDACVCDVDEPASLGYTAAVAETYRRVGTTSAAACRPPARVVASASATRVLDGAHVASALAVSFARGLNDTPKIAAVAVAAGGVGATGAVSAVVVAMALGGLLAARRVIDTMAWRVTRMDPAEGLGGNLVTTGLVLSASAFALPVSTTHVSCGALFGIAAGNRSGQRGTIVAIALAWLLTMPLGALFAAAFFTLIDGVPA